MAMLMQHYLRMEVRPMIDTAVELTQAALALAVVMGTLGLLLTGQAIPSDWWTITALVVGYYFGQSRSPRVSASGVVAGLIGAALVLALVVGSRVLLYV